MIEIKQQLPAHFPPAKMPPLQRLIVLALATGHTDEWWSADDVVRATGVVRRSALKHLRALVEAGFVSERVNADNGRKTYRLLGGARRRDDLWPITGKQISVRGGLG